MKSNLSVKMYAIAVAAIFSMLSAASHAQHVYRGDYRGGYSGVRYANIENKSKTILPKLTTPTVMMNAGYQFNPNFALEGRIGFGVSDDVIAVDVDDNERVDVSVKIGNYIGVFSRFGTPVNERFYPYSLLGYGKVDIRANISTGAIDDAASDFGYGFGANLSFTDRVAGNIEYVIYSDNSNEKISGIFFGLQYRR